MATVNTGGPAFPRPMGWNGHGHHEEHESNSDQRGMDMRDYFASHAMDRMGLDLADRLAAPTAPLHDEIEDDDRMLARYVVPPEEVARRIAVASYLIADAMLKERSK